jgi:ribonuclease BN (tRNA processing enzyme)
LALRIEFGGKTIVYATDIEGYVGVDQNLAAFSQRADVLIHDAQYTDEHYCGQVPGLPATQGWGHSTVRMACALAQSAQAKKLVLFHHDPGYNDDLIAANETLARQLRPNSLAAYEGLEIEIGNENVPHQATKAAADEVKFPYLHSSPAANPGN